jgi:hypothetical protein
MARGHAIVARDASQASEPVGGRIAHICIAILAIIFNNMQRACE